MKKFFTKVASVIVSLLLCTSFAISAPLATASAAENHETPTEAVQLDAKEESIGEFLSMFGSLFDVDFIRNLLSVDWSVFFNGEYDWNAFFNGELDTLNSDELSVLLGTFGDVVSGINFNEEQAEYFKNFLKTKYCTISLENIIDRFEDLLHGDYNDYIDLFKGDYSALAEILDDVNIKVLIDNILENKSDKLNELLGGNYDLIKELIDGNYSYLKDLLSGDYTWIESILNGVDTNLKVLFENLELEKVKELIGEKGSDVLLFVEEYYDQIVALCNGDYSYINDIKDGEYNDMFELFEDVSKLVGFEYEEIFGNVADKLLALDNDTVSNMINLLVKMLYNVLPEEYKNIMDGIVDKIEDIIDRVEDIILVIIERYGDLDDDDEVSLTDVVLVQKNLANLEEFDEYQLEAADVDHDKQITLADVVLMQQHVAELVVITEC